MACLVGIESPLRDIVAVERICGRDLVIIADHAVSLEGILNHLLPWNTVFQRQPEIIIAGRLAVTHDREVGVLPRCRGHNFYPRGAVDELDQFAVNTGTDIVFASHHGVHPRRCINIGVELDGI